jgi:hypothetical protein
MTDQPIRLARMKDVPDSAWKKLSETRIYFGHQSVGVNIVDGIKDVLRENPQIKLRVVETSSPSEVDGPVFSHSTIGKNEEPLSKIEAFESFMKKNGTKIDVAFFKFCFVDIDSKTDVKKVFAKYKDSISKERKNFPGTTLLHVTVPLLRRQENGFKARIKKLVGVGGDGFFDDEHNVARNSFNDLLRGEYGGKEPIFDLAGIESTLPDGKRLSFEKGGKIYYSLVPEYTNDGGHLNEKGQKIVAEQFLIFLATLSR